MVKACSTSVLKATPINCSTSPKIVIVAIEIQFGDIEHVELVYSFGVKEPNLMDAMSMPHSRGGKKSIFV